MEKNGDNYSTKADITRVLVRVGMASEAGMTQAPRHFNVLFLCTGNSARSIMAEAILNHKGHGHFTAYSAGSDPTGHVHPEARRQLDQAHISTEGLRSKSWHELSRTEAPEIHFVFNLCDREANEVCPAWHGRPLTARWSLPDPVAVTGTQEEIQRAFSDVYHALDRRITLFLNLPLESHQKDFIQSEIDRIGRQ